MKITFELPDDLYDRLKRKAELSGKTIDAVLREAVRDKLTADPLPESIGMGWRSVFGKATSEEVREVQDVIDQEFERVLIRDHVAFLKSYGPEDKGLYDDL